MDIAFVTNVINAHQSFLADEFWRLTDGHYTYIELREPPESLKYKNSTAFDVYSKPYLLQAWRSEENRSKAMEICKNVDVLISGGDACVLPYESERLKLGKLTFEPAERQLKRGLLNAFSPVALAYRKMYRTCGHDNLYKLCASAYMANDMYLLHPFFRGKCYKWGYFTQVPDLNIDEVISKRRKNRHIKILCVARLINWKRIDMPIRMASVLKRAGYDFELSIVGEGEMKPKLEQLTDKLKVTDCVHFLGLLRNEEVYELMREHDIFTFTSNKQEGWGAVLNEAMSNGCACVASDLIGATPFLIKDRINGYQFKTGDVTDLANKVKNLIDSQELREKIQRNSYQTMKDTWNPRVAAERFYALSEGILRDNAASFSFGPCSLAEPIKGKTFAS